MPTVLGISMNTPLPGGGNMTIGQAAWGGIAGAAVSIAINYAPTVASWACSTALSAGKALVEWVDETDPPETDTRI